MVLLRSINKIPPHGTPEFEVQQREALKLSAKHAGRRDGVAHSLEARLADAAVETRMTNIEYIRAARDIRLNLSEPEVTRLIMEQFSR